MHRGPACAWVEGYMSEAHRVLGTSASLLGVSTGEMPQQLADLPVESAMPHPFDTMWALAAILLPAHHPLVVQLLNHYSEWCEREMGLFGRVSHSWGRWALIHMHTLSPTGENHWPKRVPVQ